jgi:hypothetical protein
MQKMARVMCNPWKKTFTLVPQAPLTMISPHVALKSCHVHMSFVKFWKKVMHMGEVTIQRTNKNIKPQRKIVKIG